MTVTVWTTKNCVQCKQTKREFDKAGIEYDEQSLEDNPDKLEEFKEQGFMSAPIVVSGSRVWSGFRFEQINGLIKHLKAQANKSE